MWTRERRSAAGRMLQDARQPKLAGRGNHREVRPTQIMRAVSMEGGPAMLPATGARDRSAEVPRRGPSPQPMRCHGQSSVKFWSLCARDVPAPERQPKTKKPRAPEWERAARIMSTPGRAPTGFNRSCARKWRRKRRWRKPATRTRPRLGCRLHHYCSWLHPLEHVRTKAGPHKDMRQNNKTERFRATRRQNAPGFRATPHPSDGDVARRNCDRQTDRRASDSRNAPCLQS